MKICTKRLIIDSEKGTENLQTSLEILAPLCLDRLRLKKACFRKDLVCQGSLRSSLSAS
jgi:hypothetical protein